MATDSYTPAPSYEGAPPARRHGAGMATTALVLGILALVTTWTIVGGIVLGLLAVVFGIVGVRRAKVGAPGKVRAIFGIALGVISILVSVFWIAVIGAFWNSDAVQCVRNSDNQAQVQACADQVNDQVNSGN